MGAVSRTNEWKAHLFSLGVDALKSQVYGRLGVIEPGAPGYCWFPKKYPSRYYHQLTSERCITHYRKGVPTKVWMLRKGVRNEALDCRVYAWAAYLNLQIPDINRLCDELAGDSVPSVDESERTMVNPGLQNPYGR